MDDQFTTLTMRNPAQWAFSTAPWRQDAQGVITNAAEPADDNLAIFTQAAYTDFEAELDFRWDIQGSDSGFAFRARDAGHYYLAHFPCTGQQFRSEHFWAAISKADGSGWLRVLKTAIVPGVLSEMDLWHSARLTVRGDEFRLWVDGRPALTLRDGTHEAAGYVGLETYNGRDPDASMSEFGDRTARVGSGNSFRSVRVRGRKASAPAWDATVAPAANWSHPCPRSELGRFQYVSGAARGPNGELLLKLAFANAHASGADAHALLRSGDNGRSWSDPERLPRELGNGALHAANDGALAMHVMQTDPPFELGLAYSRDDGRTWTEVVQTGRLRLPPELDIAHAYAGKLIALHDGTLLRFGYTVGAGASMHGGSEAEGRRYLGAPTPESFSFCIRSEDDGATWSPTIRVDGPNISPQFQMDAKETASETSAAVTRDGSLIALIRPETSPWMWESWSHDGGLSWTPSARGHFAMYACTDAMTSTSSGALFIAGRHPGIAAQVSLDDGMTWGCTRIDTPFYANGFAMETETDVVLYVYDGKYSDPRVRAQLLRITPAGLEPVR